MNAGPSITVEFEWRFVEPNGSACIKCGEEIFLRMAQAFIKLPKEDFKAVQVSLCQSCAAAYGLDELGLVR